MAISKRNSGKNSYWFGKTFSKLHKKRLKESRKNQINRFMLPILQLDLKSKLIREWKSSRLASKVLKLQAPSLSQVLNGKRIKTGGFRWKFK